MKVVVTDGGVGPQSSTAAASACDAPNVEAICFVGWGAIAQRVYHILTERSAPVRIVAVAVRDAARGRRDLPEGAQLIADPGDLAATKATLVVEAAGRASVLPWGRAALASGADFAVSSASAFVEEAVTNDLSALAEQTGTQVLLPSGGLGGIDALSAASRLSLRSVTHRIIKPPQAWALTRAEELCDLLNLTEATTFFCGTAHSAAETFPQNANVAVISSLASVGLERTRIELIADPGATRNIHEICAEGDFGSLNLRLENRPLPGNPKSSETAALSLVRLIENRFASIVI